MKTVTGVYDGKSIHLDKEVHVDHEMPVLVTFLELPPDEDFREFLLSGPTWTEDEIRSFEEGEEMFRRWKL